MKTKLKARAKDETGSSVAWIQEGAGQEHHRQSQGSRLPALRETQAQSKSNPTGNAARGRLLPSFRQQQVQPTKKKERSPFQQCLHLAIVTFSEAWHSQNLHF